jgi:hypothetical protein
MSPTRSPTGIGHGHNMRSSLRTSIDSGTPSLRNRSSPKSKSSRIPGFGKAKQKIKPMSPPPPYRSRFANDSDDELDDREISTAPNFPSRFADSDDELDSPLASSPSIPTGLTALRGRPRISESDEDSTELEGENEISDAEPSRRARKRMVTPAVPSTKDIEAATNGKPTEASALATGTMRKDAVATNGLASTKYTTSTAATPERPKRKRRFSLPGFGRHKEKQRDSSVPPLPSFAHDDSRPGTSDSTTKPRVPKLHRRSTPSTLPQVAEGMKDGEASWPLPLSPQISANDDQERPTTSDGGLPDAAGKEIAVERPAIGKVGSAADQTPGAAYGRSGKKKRFPMLRRAFGLKD